MYAVRSILNVRTAVKKATKKVEKVELKESFDKIKDTASKVNAQVMETTTEVVEDVFETGKQLRDAATQTVKDTFETVRVLRICTSRIKKFRAFVPFIPPCI